MKKEQEVTVKKIAFRKQKVIPGKENQEGELEERRRRPGRER